jgi:hypothetical protein
MEANRRFTILTFPQHFDGNTLKINILFLPRNQNPLNSAIALHPIIPEAPSLADAQLSFTANIISGLADFPMNIKVNRLAPLTIANPSAQNKNSLFTALANSFSITNLNQVNSNLNITSSEKAPEPIKKENLDRSINKYLPFTYRNSFNFIAPRIRNAKIDDSYFCAIRDAGKKPGFIMSPDTISWGKVFAYALRQPQLAKELGMIYETELIIEETDFPKGGWLFIDINDESSFFQQQQTVEEGIINNTINEETDGFFIKKYAARIPALELTNERSVFAAVQFPVLFKKPADIVDPVPKGNFDQVFIEASEYDDGFSKIIHAFQPISHNILREESDGFHPTKEVGIRLGWDDEQILIWYIRQMMEDESAGTNKRLDAPLGVFGYKIDVREKGSADWNSLNGVTNKIPLQINGNILPDFNGELLYQVYPSQLDGDKTKSFWLPMYFANWNGKSMVLPDRDAIEIYQNDQDVQPDPANLPNNEAGTGVTGPAQKNLNNLYDAFPIDTELRYGKIYEFRARLSDLTSGGPKADKVPFNAGQAPIADCHFKRFVAPNAVRVNDVPINNDDLVFEENELVIKRPLLDYPGVLFTDKYPNAVDLLKAQISSNLLIQQQNKQNIEDWENDPDPNKPEQPETQPFEPLGIADPDVEKVEITVEIQALKMDNLLSVSGKEAYIKFYTTTRNFPAEFDGELTVPIEFKDCNVLNFGNPSDLGDLGFSQSEIDGMTQLVLPNARNIRLTLRAVCEEKDGYYGLEKSDPNFNTRFGRTSNIVLYRPSLNEENLFADLSPAVMMKGIYLQPDPPQRAFLGNFTELLVGKQEDKIPDMIQRLAQTLGVENIGLTLVAKKGERIQFGCSNKIRHTLAPDNSSITFASKGDLMNHWLCCMSLQMERDWTWDALEDLSFVINRKRKFAADDETEAEILEVGDIEVKKTISISALHKPDRSFTKIIFIDAVEPKNDPKFPDLIELEYTVETKFKADHANQRDEPLKLELTLPVTNNPAQLPKIASAGIALSPYIRNEKYSTTEPRTRFLWIEFEEPIQDPNDIYFARVLAYSPDQLISNNDPELLLPPIEPSLPIDPEFIRIITPNQPDDDAGLIAMQPMEKALDSDKHYLLPLPPGLHSESDELFGFYTYEFRVGHANIWSTAQGRFGRALRATGIQHPAPTLKCICNRDEEKLYVTAPYAAAVHKGKNVTSDPPRTSLWCLLYAQVKQADNKDYRNILLDEKKLDWRVRVEHKKNVNWIEKYDETQINTLKYISINNWKDELSYGNLQHVIKLTDFSVINKDATKYGTTIWSNKEINQILNMFGLPLDISLSVLCVEMLPHITNIYDHINKLNNQKVKSNLGNVVSGENIPNDEEIKFRSNINEINQAFFDQTKPLSNQLGHFRILRTSPLVEVPYICCTDC